MNNKTNFDLKSIKFIYQKNKQFILPIVTILISLLLIFQFIFPQLGVLANRQKELALERDKLKILNSNLSILINTNEELLDSQVKILTTALPINKDFLKVLDTIYSVARKTGANLGNFSFKVGDINQDEKGDMFPTIKITVPINSSMNSINSFVESLGKSLPLAEVYSVKINKSSSGVDLSFYYKSLNLSGLDLFSEVKPISQAGLNLVNQMNGFDTANSSLIGLTSDDASSSAQ